jgi:hypothetical protein
MHDDRPFLQQMIADMSPGDRPLIIKLVADAAAVRRSDPWARALRTMREFL